VVVTVFERQIRIGTACGDGTRPLYTEPSAHAEVHQQHIAGRKFNEKIFPAAGNGSNRMALQFSFEAGGEWLPKIPTIEKDAFETRANHRRFKRAT
jgi:hypothetical protein